MELIRFDDNVVCECCGGDGSVQLSEHPEFWGEDCFCEEDRLVNCPECSGSGVSR